MYLLPESNVTPSNVKETTNDVKCQKGGYLHRAFPPSNFIAE